MSLLLHRPVLLHGGAPKVVGFVVVLFNADVVNSILMYWFYWHSKATRYTVQLSKGFPSLMMPHFKASTSWVVIKDKKIKIFHVKILLLFVKQTMHRMKYLKNIYVKIK